MSLSFRPMDLGRHADSCIAFRRDSHCCSFGSDDAFVQMFGSDGSGYLDWLRDRIAEESEGFVHAWNGRELVGQVGMRVRDDPPIGHIHLFYLIAPARGQGSGDQLHEFALELFRKRPVSRIQLNASPTNQRALAFYKRHGWRDFGLRPGREDVHMMELLLVEGST